MKKYKDGTVITKEFKDMSYDELCNVDMLTLANDEEELLEFLEWRRIRDEEHFAPMNY